MSRKTDTGYVYLLLAPKEGLYKIGLSADPSKRAKAVQSEVQQGCLLVHTIKTNNAPRLEADMHALFASERVQGEWFRLSAENVQEFCRESERNYGDAKAIRDIVGRRIVGLPEPLAAVLDEMAAEEFSTITQQITKAVIEYLRARNRLPVSS